jgi:hypothetical protein
MSENNQAPMVIVCNSDSTGVMPTMIMGASGVGIGEDVLIFFCPNGANVLLKGELEKFQGKRGLPDPVELFNTILDEGARGQGYQAGRPARRADRDSERPIVPAGSAGGRNHLHILAAHRQGSGFPLYGGQYDQPLGTILPAFRVRWLPLGQVQQVGISGVMHKAPEGLNCPVGLADFGFHQVNLVVQVAIRHRHLDNRPIIQGPYRGQP